MTARRATVERDVVFATSGDLALTMDLHRPHGLGPWPCVVAVHGGGWSEGDKAGFDFGLARRGWLVASINYRLYPAFRFPSMIEDVKSAIRFLRAHARQYNLDPDRMALLGHSAGGHLAALAALAPPEAGWDVGPHREQASTVRAAVVLSGPSDLRRELAPGWANDLRFTVFEPAVWERASPVSWVRPDMPPLLIVHGMADPVVPVEQARLLHAAATAKGGTAHLILVRGAGHGFEPVTGPVWPPVPLVLARVLGFLRRSLGLGGSGRWRGGMGREGGP